MDVSIVVTTYNYAAYIEECIASCLFQDGTNLDFEVIVVDDGSIDGTPEILEKLNDARLKKFRISNSGIEGASNFGFQKASGDYLVRVDADDRLLSNYLSLMQGYLDSEFDFFYSDYVVINADGNVIDEMLLPDFDATEIRGRGDFLATGTLYSAQMLKAFGYYSQEIRNSGLENYELMLRLLDAGIVGKHIPSRSFCYRRHALNISVSRNDQIIQNGEALFSRMDLGPYTTNRYHPYNSKNRDT